MLNKLKLLATLFLKKTPPSNHYASGLEFGLLLIGTYLKILHLKVGGVIIQIL